MRRFQIILLLVFLGLAGWLGLERDRFFEEESPEKRGKERPTSEISPEESAVEDPVPTDSRFTRQSDGRVLWNPSVRKSQQLNTSPNPEDDLGIIAQLFSAYRLVYQENPAGTDNFEFITPLTGENPKKVVFLPRDHPSIRENELLDRWGRPYHFHPISGQQLDIRSAGPDGKLWTGDDLTLIKKPKSSREEF